jgi:zinc transporter 1
VIAECASQTDEHKSDIVIKMNEEDVKSKKKASMNMHGVFLHVLADALGSVVVIISALIIKFVPHDPSDTKHWIIYIDPILSVIIVIIITISTIPLFRDTTSILLQTIPKHLEIHRVKIQLLETIPDISSIHELHIWRLTDEKIIATAHLHRKTLTNYMLVAEKVKHFFHSIGIHSSTVQYECEDDQREPLLSQNNIDNQSKIAGDCLLRCENNACDNQTCCTITSARSDILLNKNTDNIMQVSSIIQSEQYENPLQTHQIGIYESVEDEKF